MPLSRTNLERQLEVRKAAQSEYESSMDASDAKARKKDPRWRKLDADRRAVVTRLHALKGVEERDAALAAAKAGGPGE